MMARSTTRSKQRPDTLMQDRSCRIDQILLQRTIVGLRLRVRSRCHSQSPLTWLGERTVDIHRSRLDSFNSTARTRASEGVRKVTRRLKVYSDYKSPYAYLAKDLTYELERQTGATVEWLPYTLDIPAYLGSAEVESILEELGSVGVDCEFCGQRYAFDAAAARALFAAPPATAVH